MLLLLGDINLKTNCHNKKWYTMGTSSFLQLKLFYWAGGFSACFYDRDLQWRMEHSLLKGMHFIHLNVNSLQFKIDEIHCIAKLTNATVIGLREN